MIQKLDPLYVIFEQHLFNFQDPEIDRKTLVMKIVADYLAYLRKQNISVPRALEQPIVEELSQLVNTMLVKKIYGCLTPKDYQVGLKTQLKRKAKSRYKKVVARAPRASRGAKTATK
jgi:hypothetical protein